MSREVEAKKVLAAIKKLALAKGGLGLINDLRLVLALERFIARIGQHPKLANHIVYKGGFVLFKTVETNRFTRDIDALAIGVSRDSLVDMITRASKLELNDGFWFGDLKVEDLNDQGPYGGFRFNCAFQIGNPPDDAAKIKKLSRIHIDIGFGDALESVPPRQAMPNLIEETKSVSWSIYPLEYIFAEKMEALFSRGSANSRAKDIFDMCLIFSKCDLTKLKMAIADTFNNRKTELPNSFVKTGRAFDLSTMKNAWPSVEITSGEENKNFEVYWLQLLAYFKVIDEH